MSVRIGDVASAVARAFPLEWAEPWDNVGLLAGDPASDVTGVLVTLDATPAAVREAVGRGANLLVTHHPATLVASTRVTASATPLYQAAASGIAIIAAHTNLDRAPAGAAALPAALGLPQGEGLERSTAEASVVTVFCPPDYREALVSAMASAGAGRIGMYAACSFASPGEGAFTPEAETSPATGLPGTPSTAEELRIEMVCPPILADAVVSAARAAHPYEEPLILVSNATVSRGAVRMGRIADLESPVRLQTLAAAVGNALGVVPRAWGDPDRATVRVATAGGSGGSLISHAVEQGADVLVTGEVRYHDALTAVEAGLAIVEAGHDATEWPLVAVLGDVVSAIPDLGVDVLVEKRGPGWWTP